MIEMKIIQGMHFIPVPDIVQRSTYLKTSMTGIIHCDPRTQIHMYMGA
jgi:hypothetical protein